MSSQPQSQDQACAQRVVEITEADLPLCCPQPNGRVWDAHPRVFLRLGKDNSVTCPYCGTYYVLKS